MPDEAWYADAVNWAAAQGIVKGYSEDTFAPLDAITREQMITILFRYARDYKKMVIPVEAELNGFADSSLISDYAVEAFRWAVAEGVLRGDENGNLSPQASAIRAAAAAVIVRFSSGLEA